MLYSLAELIIDMDRINVLTEHTGAYHGGITYILAFHLHILILYGHLLLIMVLVVVTVIAID